MALGWLAPVHLRLVSAPRRQRLVTVLARLSRGATSLLDVGAGDGLVGYGVAQALSATIEGVDALPRAAAPFHVAAAAVDGGLPFASASFDVVLLCDVLHHTLDPDALLREALRVARHAVVLKDHFAFGRWSQRLLHAMDVVGNRPYGVAVPGVYSSPEAWRASFAACGAEIEELCWPLDVHPAALRLFTRSELQFAARLVRKAGSHGS